MTFPANPGGLLNNLLGGFLEHPPVYQKHLEISQFMNVNLLNRVPEQASVHLVCVKTTASKGKCSVLGIFPCFFQQTPSKTFRAHPREDLLNRVPEYDCPTLL
jgi:hypothetical protein